MNRLNKTESAVFLYCRFSLFLTDQFFQIICKLINRIQGLNLLITSLPSKASRTHVESFASRAIQKVFAKPCLVNLISKDTLHHFSLKSENVTNVLFSVDGYTTDTLEFFWHQTEPVLTKDDLRIPQFSLGDITTERCDKSYVGGKFTKRSQDPR